MAKIKIAGDAVIVTSALKTEDLKTIAKYRPEALTLMGGEEKKTPIFCIIVKDSGTGDMNANGVTFTGTTRDEYKRATLTMTFANMGENVKDWAADKFGTAIERLNALEAKLPDVLNDIAAVKAKGCESITIAE